MWLKEGDQNTKYFHSLVKEGSSVNKIFSIQDRDGVTLTEKEQINGKFVRFFIDLLGSKHENVSMDRIEAMLDVIPKLVLVDQNSNLVKECITVNNIFSIQDGDGVSLTEQEQINGEAIRYFTYLLG